MRSKRHVLALALSLIACAEEGNQVKSKGNRNAGREAPGQQEDLDAASLVSLFSNGQDFNLQNVKKGKVCGSVQDGSLTFE